MLKKTVISDILFHSDCEYIVKTSVKPIFTKISHHKDQKLLKGKPFPIRPGRNPGGDTNPTFIYIIYHRHQSTRCNA